MRCPFCGAERGGAGAACAACGETSPPEPRRVRWWQSNATVIVALAVLGPFALPLVWAHPRYKLATKLALTVMVLAFSVWATLFTRDLLSKLASRLAAGS